MSEARYRAAERALWSSLGITPVERTLDLGVLDGRVRVQELGDGPPVLFIHGANTSGISWATLAAKLPGFRCILLDRPGTGLSESPRRRPDLAGFLRTADALVPEVLDALGVASAHVVATSLGGLIGLRGAAANPDRVERMVQFSWPAGAPTTHVPASMRLMAIPGMASLAAAAPATDRTVRAIFRSVGHGPSLDAGRITKADVDTYLALLRETSTLRNELALGGITASLRGGLRPELLPESLLASIRTPTMFIWGERDAFGGPDIARDVVARIRGAKLQVLPGAGHAPWLDDLDRCAALTATFLPGGGV